MKKTAKEILTASFQELAQEKSIEKLFMKKKNGALKLEKDELKQLKELLDKAVMGME